MSKVVAKKSASNVSLLEKPKRIKLAAGTVVKSEQHRYVVRKMLGAGGFGDVYKVAKSGTNEVYALKTEPCEAPQWLRRLKMEAEVLGVFSLMKQPHCMALIDRGRTEDYKYIVMPLLGPTLDKVRKKMPDKQFSADTAHKICIQLLESLRDLHKLGYLHRDLKPQNFAIGHNMEDKGLVYMIDFGVAKRFIDHDGKHHVPRERVSFMGTQRYAPRVTHRQEDQGRKDDLESLCYVMADIFSDQNLPWKGQKDRTLVLQLKENFVSEKGSIVAGIFAKLPAEYVKILRTVDKLAHEEAPPYETFIGDMKKAVENSTTPLDWMVPGRLEDQESSNVTAPIKPSTKEEDNVVPSPEARKSPSRVSTLSKASSTMCVPARSCISNINATTEETEHPVDDAFTPLIPRRSLIRVANRSPSEITKHPKKSEISRRRSPSEITKHSKSQISKYRSPSKK